MGDEPAGKPFCCKMKATSARDCGSESVPGALNGICVWIVDQSALSGLPRLSQEKLIAGERRARSAFEFSAVAHRALLLEQCFALGGLFCGIPARANGGTSNRAFDSRGTWLRANRLRAGFFIARATCRENRAYEAKHKR